MVVGLAGSAFSVPVRAIETGRPGWLLERFGNEVAILRTRKSGERASGAADVLLSCEGGDRRLRIGLQDDGTGPVRDRRPGSLLLRSRDAGAAIVAGYQPAGGRALQASGDAVVEVAREIAARQGDVALLLHPDGRPFVLGRLTALHLNLPFGPGDAAAFREFVRSCAPSGDPQKRP